MVHCVQKYARVASYGIHRQRSCDAHLLKLHLMHNRPAAMSGLQRIAESDGGRLVICACPSNGLYGDVFAPFRIIGINRKSVAVRELFSVTEPQQDLVCICILQQLFVRASYTLKILPDELCSCRGPAEVKCRL